MASKQQLVDAVKALLALANAREANTPARELGELSAAAKAAVDKVADELSGGKLDGPAHHNHI